MKRTKKSRSGPSLPDSRREELGQRRLQVWLRAEQLRRLDALCFQSGLSRGEQVGVFIDSQSEKAPK